MPLSVIAGLPGDGRSAFAHRRIIEAVSLGDDAILVVPSAGDATRARAELAGVCPVGARVATLDGLIQSEWALMGDGRRIAQGLTRDVLLARALVSANVTDRAGRGVVGLLRMLVERAPRRKRPHGDARSLPGRIVDAVDRYLIMLEEYGMVEVTEVCEVLAASRPPAAVIVADGFSDLRPEHESLLVSWGDAGARIVVSLPWREGHPGSEATTAQVERLRSNGAVVAQLPPATDAPAELQRVRDDLFAGTAPSPGEGAVALVVAEGEEAEARHIASVAAGLISSGADPASIVIAFADPGRHIDWLRRALGDLNVRTDERISVPVGETALGSALLQLNSCVAGGLERTDLSVMLRTTFSGVVTAQADEADAAWRAGGPQRGRGLLRRVRELDALVAEAMSLRGQGIGPEQARRWKKLADRMLANANPGSAPVPDAAAALDAAAHRAFCRTLQEALELGAGEVGADELWERFAESRVTAQAALRRGHVLVTTIDDVASGEFAHVILGGLTAGEIPRRGSEDRLEGDAVSRAMRLLGIENDPDERMRAERRAFYLAVATATSTLTLTRQGTSDEGSALRESVFWDEFLDLYRRPGDELPADAEPRITPATIDPLEAGGAARVTRGLLADGAEGSLGDASELSPSQIETYLSCPYKWFVERQIRAEAPDEAIDRAAAGRLAHDALARFYREWRLSAPRVTPDTRERAAQLAAEAVAAAAASVGVPETLEELALLDAVGPSVVALVLRDATFLPDYAPAQLEWAFGGANEVPAVDIGGVALKGRADRIDVGPEGLVIVDYKSGHASTRKQIGSGGLVQLQLYAVAASRTLGLPVAGGLYRSLKDGSDRGFVLSSVAGAFKRDDVVDRDTLSELLECAVADANRVAVEMRQGRIEPTPSADACRYCAASGFCGKAVSA